jgi:D-arabinose 1-dehydrogenase-like Zn-dependent alcohol dehydrogenase
VRQGVEGAQLITPLVFMIVLGTVLLNATTARFFSKIVGVFLTKSDGILMVGASKFSRLIAQYLITQGRHVVLIDSNSSNIEKTARMGLEAFTADIYTESISNNIELNDIGFLLSFTGNNDVNKYAISKLGGQFGENGSFRIISSSEKKQLLDKNDLNIFSYHTDFLEMTEIARNFPKVNEIEVTSTDDLTTKIKQMKPYKEQAPLFVKTSNGLLETIPVFYSLKNEKIKPVALVYLGKETEINESTS